jgi:hypothetical protein
MDYFDDLVDRMGSTVARRRLEMEVVPVTEDGRRTIMMRNPDGTRRLVRVSCEEAGVVVVADVESGENLGDVGIDASLHEGFRSRVFDGRDHEGICRTLFSFLEGHRGSSTPRGQGVACRSGASLNFRYMIKAAKLFAMVVGGETPGLSVNSSQLDDIVEDVWTVTTKDGERLHVVFGGRKNRVCDDGEGRPRPVFVTVLDDDGVELAVGTNDTEAPSAEIVVLRAMCEAVRKLSMEEAYAMTP